jgi:hypothetical protein
VSDEVEDAVVVVVRRRTAEHAREVAEGVVHRGRDPFVVEHFGCVCAAEVRQILGGQWHERAIGRALRRLADAGAIETFPARRWGQQLYRPCAVYTGVSTRDRPAEGTGATGSLGTPG